MNSVNVSRHAVGTELAGHRFGVSMGPSLGALAAVVALGLLAAPGDCSAANQSSGRVRGLDAIEDESASPRAMASILSLDFDPRAGATVIGITSSAPLGNHTVYESDASTVVIELPDVDVSRLEPTAMIGTPQVERVSVETFQRGATTLARFEVRRTPGARRSVAIDPKNPNRLEVTLESAGGALPTGSRSEAAPVVAPAKVLAAMPQSSPAATKPARSESSLAAMSVPQPQPVQMSMDRAPVSHAASSVAAPSQRGAGKLTDLTVEQSADGRTLIRLICTKPMDVEPMVLQNAPRLILDLKDTINALAFANLPVRNSSVLKVRVSQFEPLPEPVTRVVLDWSAEQPYSIQRGPDSILVIVGSGDPMPPAMASNDFGAMPASGGAGMTEMVSGPATLANLGRPSTLSGAAPAPLPPADQRAAASSAGAQASGPMRETADVGATRVVDPAAAARGARFREVKVTEDAAAYNGEPISISVKDADLQDLFRLFHEVSGLNIVVDPAVKGRTITLELVDVPWDQAMDLVLRVQGLGQALDGNVLRIAPITKLAQEEQQQKALQEAKDLAGNVEQIAFPLSYATGASAESIVRKSLSARGDVVLDRRTNTLIIKDLPDRLEEVKSLLGLLDLPTKQVMIESRIVETTLDFSKAVGIQWGFSYIADRAFGNSTGFSFPRSVAADYAVNVPVSNAASILGLSFRNILNTFALDIRIAALEDRGKARIISRPMIMVQNNEEASIESGVQIPIATTTATEIDVTYVSASLKLTVQPQITADDNVVMDLKVENNAPVFIQTAGDNASISTRQAKTVVAVPNGGTTIIGGIYQVNEGAASTRVPFMSRIPLLGWLFRNKTIDRTNDELLIFITPRIQKA